MESNPEKSPIIRIVFGGESFECTRDNLFAYTHHLQPEVDHLFIVDDSEESFEDEDVEESERMLGRFVFRQMLGNFDEIVDYMHSKGFIHRHTYEPEDIDLRQYYKYLETKTGRVGTAEQETIPEQRTELTPRMERYVNNHGLFLQHVEITVDDFKGRR